MPPQASSPRRHRSFAAAAILTVLTVCRLSPVEVGDILLGPADLRLDGDRATIATYDPGPLLSPDNAPDPSADHPSPGAGPSAPPVDPAADVDPATWYADPRFWWVNGGLTVGFSVYGVCAWDWGTASFHPDAEGWFGRHTKFGGADKLGHAFAAYGASALFCQLYDTWGYGHRTATWLGVLSGWTQTMLIEVGDGISREHGFSYEDALCNTAGAALQLLRRTCPRIGETVDFRWEYFPSPAVRHGASYDILTDYSGSRYALVFKPEGIFRTDSWLRFVEIHGGCFTRGYVREDAPFIKDATQHWYVGIGFSVTETLGVFTAASWPQVFNYYQVPFTYVGYDQHR